jgi:hypothetical protein
MSAQRHTLLVGVSLCDVMNNKEIAHLWANQSRKQASGSHFYFQGDTIYSYGSHFPIARHYKGVVLFTNDSYSNSTARHMSITRGACSHLTSYSVDDPTKDPSGKDVAEYGKRINAMAIKAAKARNPDAYLTCLESEVREANAFCTRFGFKTRFEMPDNLDELRERARASAEKERKAKAVKLAKFEAECAETVQKWLAGESVQVPYQLGTVYLRSIAVKDESLPLGGSMAMETSKGARVPLSEAERAFRFAVIQRSRGWHRNGDVFKVGDYQLDAVNEQGVVAGCHRIAWNEIERFAKAQGWVNA